MKIGAVILSAGYSSRMDGFKPLMLLGRKTLLAHTADLFERAGISAITVVTGHKCKEVEAEVARLGLTSVRNSEYDQGMFSSVWNGVRKMQQVDGFFLLPVDTPLLYPATISRLMDSFDGHSVLLPVFRGQQGHPPLIPARIIPAILDHDGQGGLRTVLEAQPCLNIPVWDQGILMDADTPEDFSVLQDRLSRIGTGEPEEAMELARLFMPSKGITHGLATAEIAVQIGCRLNSHGYALNLGLLHNAALLHDVGKGSPNHEVQGGKILSDLGLLNLAGIVAAHRSLPPPATGRLTEKEIVCLADKLVRGNRRVSVQQRFAEKRAIYADDPDASQAIQQRLTDTLALQTLVEQQAGCDMSDILREENAV